MTIKEVSERFQITQDTLRYYEKAKVIPPVTRTSSGIRNYSEEDLKWVELAKCMRDAGVSVEALAEYVRLFQAGDETIEARVQLLVEQRSLIMERQKQIEETLKRINRKISRYERALESGEISWEK
jgi:DNA-binding transcriptional MerR regulator